MAKKKTEWLDSDGNLNPDIFWSSDSDVDWEEIFKHAYIGPPRNAPEMLRERREEMRWFLDHWLIVRKDGDTVLNGTAEEFEKQLRDLIDGSNTTDSRDLANARTDKDS